MFLIKNSIFLEDCYNKKNENYAWVDLKYGLQVVTENFWRTESQRNYLERLKRKVGIFTETKKIFNLNYFNK